MECLDQMAVTTEALLQRVPASFRARCLVSLEREDGNEGEAGDPDAALADMPDEELEEELLRLARRSAELAESAKGVGAAALVRRLRGCRAQLDLGSAWLGELQRVAACARQVQESEHSSSNSADSPASEALNTSPRVGRAPEASRVLSSRSHSQSPSKARESSRSPKGSAVLSPSFGVASAGASRLREEAKEPEPPAARNPFGVEAAARNPFAEKSSANPFDSDSDAAGAERAVVKSLTNPFSTEGSEERNPFDSASRSGSLGGGPFSSPFADEVAGEEGPACSPLQDATVGFTAMSPTSLEEISPPANSGSAPGTPRTPRTALLQRPLCMDKVSEADGSAVPRSPSPRVTSLLPGGASSLEMWRRPSPRQMAEGLAGCLCNVRPPDGGGVSSEELQQLAAVSPVKALRAGDAALARGRLGNSDYSSWEWRDHAVEEGHQLLRQSSQGLADLLDEEGWAWFSYELLLLSRHLLREGSSAMEQVTALIPICRVRLGINSQLHHHLAELSRPDAETVSPLDVRYRAALLLRMWAHWESFEYGTVADPSKEWAGRWICTQLRLLRGSVIERAMQLQEEGGDVSACARCFQALRELNEIALSGGWGKVQPVERLGEASGRRLLTILCKELDVLKPDNSWCFNVVFAARVFSTLWRAAADVDAEDRLSLDAPNTAAALLSGLHPHLAPLQLETHALLLVQQVWAAAFSSSSLQFPAKALEVSASILSDFSQWLQKTPVDAASCFARQGQSSAHTLPLELVARRLLTVDMRDQLVQTLREYRRHFEPAAFGPALKLWERCYRETRRSELARSRSHEDRQISEESADQAALRSEELDELLRCFGRWFVWESSTKAAEMALSPFDEPPQVPPGEEAWKRLGPKIKNYLQGLTDAVQSLLEELECEKTFYNEAWVAFGLSSHLQTAASAMVAAVRPRVERLLSGVWPTEPPVLEVPPGGGRLIQVLEALDREASRARDKARPTDVPLVDILVPHVTAALSHGLETLDKEITSHALDGSPDQLFVPLRPPSSIFCQAVVTLWRFIHDALDAPLSLGISVDMVTEPFMRFLNEVLHRSGERLVRPCEQREAFGIAVRGAQIAEQLKNTGCAISDEEEGVRAPAGDETKRARGRGRRKFFTRTSERSLAEDLSKNSIMEAKLLEVNSQVVAPSVQQVMVRLSSLGFCCAELAEVQGKLFKMINSGDDVGVPTARHNEARMLICEELPDLQESLLHRGQTLARYLAARLVYHELRSELFEKLYFFSPLAGSGTPSPGGSSTPRGGASMTPSSFVESPPVLTLKDVVMSRQNSFLSLVEQTPTMLLSSFVGQLGIELTHAWIYVIVDYLRRQKLDQIAEHLDADQEALSRAIESMMQATRRRVQTTALGGLTHDDCRNLEKKLEEVQRLSQCFIEETQSRTAEELSRYAAKLRGEVSAEEPVRERSQTPGRSQHRSASPATPATPFQGLGTAGRENASLSPRSPSPMEVSDQTPGASSKRSAKQLFQKAWKATKRMGKA
ncbi:unnamed protein product [Effrenium voratum]|uniref:Uncharacterized protein n=1 Tax=Effrenium voratum TaxID=2562239 RepID=A0AA36MR23_9DINO|nr:unnamed protein product [Effrenium voratum]